MTESLSLNELWDSATTAQHVFLPGQITSLPDVVRFYLEHSIAPETKLASAVWLRMHGEIKLQQRWFPFTAEQVINWERGMIWSARVRMYGMPVKGSDRIIDGEGAMRWKLFGLIPLVTATGSDVTRSAVGRIKAESVWLPSSLCSNDVSWDVPDSSHLVAGLVAHGHEDSLQLTINDRGQLESVKLSRWGNPEGADFHYADFGGYVDEEGTFGGYTIPTRLRIGWFFGTEQFQSDGEFFRVTVDDASYR